MSLITGLARLGGGEFGLLLRSYICVIDQACSVKMAGYWPSSFFFFAQNKERGQYPVILTKQAWSKKDLLYGQQITPKNFAFAETKRATPSW